MKLKNISIVLIILIGATRIHAQFIKKYGIKIGISATNIFERNTQPIVVNNIPISIDYPSGQLISPLISIWATVFDSNVFNVEPEISFIEKGQSNTQDINISTTRTPDISVTEKLATGFTFKYLQLNINCHLKYKTGNLLPYLIIGPDISYLISAENFLLEKDKKKNFIFGYNLGFGFNFGDLFGKNIFIEAKYNPDFSSFYENGTDFWNKVWTFNVGTEL